MICTKGDDGKQKKRRVGGADQRQVAPPPEGDGCLFARKVSRQRVERALREAYRRMEVVIE